MTKKTVWALAGMVMLVIAAIFITGCGGGSESTPVKGCGSTPVAALKTYQSKLWGFKFQYPAEVTVNENDREGHSIGVVISYEIPVVAPGKIYDAWYIEAFQNSAKMGLEEWFSSTFNTATDKDCKQMEASYTMGYYTVDFGPTPITDACAHRGTYMISPDKVTVVKLDLGQAPQYTREILSTFKFTNIAIHSIATSTDHGIVNVAISGDNFMDWSTVEYLSDGKLIDAFCGYLLKDGTLTHGWGEPESGWAYYANINQLRVLSADCRTVDPRSDPALYPNTTVWISIVDNLPTSVVEY